MSHPYNLRNVNLRQINDDSSDSDPEIELRENLRNPNRLIGQANNEVVVEADNAVNDVAFDNLENIQQLENNRLDNPDNPPARIDAADADNPVDIDQPEQENDNDNMEADNAENQNNAAGPNNAVVPGPNNMLAFNFKPPSFDGTKQEMATKWLRNFTRYARLAGVEGNARCTLLGLLMTGLAETWFNALTPAVRNNYEQLEAQFRDQFVNVEVTRLQRQMATLTRAQQAGESVDAYFLDSRSKLDDQNFDQNFQMTLLINGLRQDIRGLVLQHQPFPNINDLLNKARHIEASLKSNPYNPYLSTNAVPLLASLPREEMIATTSDLQQLEQSILNKVDRKSYRCYFCGKEGHIQRDCRARQNPRRGMSGPRRYCTQDVRQNVSRFRPAVNRDTTPRRGGFTTSYRPTAPGSRGNHQPTSGN